MIPRPSRELETEPPRDRSLRLTVRNATTTVLILWSLDRIPQSSFFFFFLIKKKKSMGDFHKYTTGLYTICTCYYRTINVLQQGRATVYQLQGLEAPMEPIPLGGITEATGSGEEEGQTCAWVQINTQHAVINPPSSDDRPALTPSHTKQSRSPMSKQPKAITAMDHRHADVSAESQLRAELKEIAGPRLRWTLLCLEGIYGTESLASGSQTV